MAISTGNPWPITVPEDTDQVDINVFSADGDVLDRVHTTYSQHWNNPWGGRSYMDGHIVNNITEVVGTIVFPAGVNLGNTTTLNEKIPEQFRPTGVGERAVTTSAKVWGFGNGGGQNEMPFEIEFYANGNIRIVGGLGNSTYFDKDSALMFDVMYFTNNG